MPTDERCTDCGRRPIHEDCPHSYCRECAEKGGDRRSFTSPIDHDKLRALVGRETADTILRECVNDGVFFA